MMLFKRDEQALTSAATTYIRRYLASEARAISPRPKETMLARGVITDLPSAADRVEVAFS